METRNPAFRRGAFGGQQTQASPQHLQEMYDAPAYVPPTPVRRMTLDDVVVRGFLTLGTLVLAGAVAWALDLPAVFAMIGLVVGLVLWAIMTFGNRANAPLVLGFAASYGVAVGIVSHAFNDLYNGVVFQAVLGTGLAFGAMLAVHTLRIIRVTPNFMKFVIGAGFALMGLMIVNLLVTMFGAEDGIGIRTDSPLGWAFSIAAILIGCFFLLLDFHAIEEGVRSGAPEKFAWYCVFGLTLSLVWIYLEILQLLSYLRD